MQPWIVFCPRFLCWELIVDYECCNLVTSKRSIIPHNLTFDLQYLLHYLLTLSRWVDEKIWFQSHVTNISWAFLQDSFYSDLCLRFPPDTIATAMLYLALHCSELEVPGNTDVHTKPWWTIFSPRTNEKELQQIANEIMKLYDDNESISMS